MTIRRSGAAAPCSHVSRNEAMICFSAGALAARNRHASSSRRRPIVMTNDGPSWTSSAATGRSSGNPGHAPIARTGSASTRTPSKTSGDHAVPASPHSAAPASSQNATCTSRPKIGRGPTVPNGAGGAIAESRNPGLPASGHVRRTPRIFRTPMSLRWTVVCKGEDLLRAPYDATRSRCPALATPAHAM